MSQHEILPIGLKGGGQLYHTIVTAAPVTGLYDFAENILGILASDFQLREQRSGLRTSGHLL